MIVFIVLLLAVGAGFLIYGITDKTHNEVHFAEATIVDYAASSTGVAAFDAVASATGSAIVNPIVEFETESGWTQVKLYNQIAANISQRYPEMAIGGKVSVKYFGPVPKVAYLTDHDLASTTVNFNTPVVVGVLMIVLGLGLGAMDFFVIS